MAQNTVVFKTQALGPSDSIPGTVITGPDDAVESFIAALPNDILDHMQQARRYDEFRVERPKDGLILTSPLACASWKQIEHMAVDVALPVDYTRFVITFGKSTRDQ